MRSVPAFLLLALGVALGGCSNSTSTSDAGADAGLSYTGGTDAADGGATDGGSEGEAAPTCNIPASANTFVPDDGGGTGCMPGLGICTDPTQYRLTCSASNPNFVPQPPTSLNCMLTTNIDPAMQNYCCPCK